MESPDKLWIQKFIKKIYSGPIKKINSVKEVSASEVGEGYASNLVRALIEIDLPSGKTTLLSLIIKRGGDDPWNKFLIETAGTFRVEIKLYFDILPKMEKLLVRSFGANSEFYWPIPYEYIIDKQIALQDLKVLGFKLADRTIGLDFEHASLAVRTIGKFHALSAVLAEQGLINPGDFDFHFLLDSRPANIIVHNFSLPSVKILSKVILESWGPEWAESARKIEEIVKLAPAKFKEIWARNNDKLNVLLHGDLWITNLMFKYSEDGTTPLHLKFLDFQCCYFNWYALDLIHFLTTSLNLEVRSRTPELLDLYHSELTSTFSHLGTTPRTVPSREDLDEDLNSLAMVGIVIACSELPLTRTQVEIDLANICLNQSLDNLLLDEIIFKHPLYVEHLKMILKSDLDKCF